MSKTSTTHTHITDAMVDRACAAGNNGTGREIMRAMLEAALNPPPEPEIPVSEAMIDAGNAATGGGDGRRAYIANIYRAMERQRRAELPPTESPAASNGVYGDSIQTRPEYVQGQRDKTARMRADLDANTVMRCHLCGVASYAGEKHMMGCVLASD